jgi:hypothetical protein
MDFKHTYPKAALMDFYRERRLCFAKSEAMGAYEKAVDKQKPQSANVVQLQDTQIRAMDKIVRATNAGWPNWMSYITGYTKEGNVNQALLEEARLRIQEKCPELNVGWFRWLISPAARTAYYTAEAQAMDSIANEMRSKIEAQDKELEKLQSRYSRNSQRFQNGGVRISLANNKSRNDVLANLQLATAKVKETYKGYTDFPQEVQNALQDEELLMEDLVSRYEVIKPHEADMLFTANQDGGAKLLDRLETYFNGGEFRLRKTPGARALQEMEDAGRKEEITKIYNQLKKAVQGIRWSLFATHNVSNYRSLLGLKNPNASDETKWTYLRERKPFAGAKITVATPSGGSIDIVTKNRDGRYLLAEDKQGKLYQLDLGPESGAQTGESINMVFPPVGKGTPVERDVTFDRISVSAR